MLERAGAILPLKNSLVILNGKMPIVFDLEKEKWMMAENEEVIKNVTENGSYQQEVFSFRDNCSTTILETSNEVEKRNKVV